MSYDEEREAGPDERAAALKKPRSSRSRPQRPTIEVGETLVWNGRKGCWQILVYKEPQTPVTPAFPLMLIVAEVYSDEQGKVKPVKRRLTDDPSKKSYDFDEDHIRIARRADLDGPEEES